MTIRCLLLSNSSFPDFYYLQPWKSAIQAFFKKNGAGKNILFVPYAAVSLPWDLYESKVSEALSELVIKSIHKESNLSSAIESADGIIIGGGNSFNLLNELQKNGVLTLIGAKVRSGTPYVGWSAGSNVATPDIATTNDMPIIWPSSYAALNLVPFNINPHYNNWKPPHHAGESRDERLKEAVIVKKRSIVALSEGTAIQVIDSAYNVFAAPTEFTPPGHVNQVKVWKPRDDSFVVVDVPLNGESEAPLNPFLEG